MHGQGPTAQPPIVTPPPKPAAAPIVTPPPARPKVLPIPPVVQWTGDRELLAWRAWRLALFLPDPDEDDYGPRLLSLSAPCIWGGPAVHAHVTPFATLENPSGIYALNAVAADRVEWRLTEHCWVTGWVALSGRVVEHTLGYRAERAVIRELRLGVGTHLAVRRLEDLRKVMDCLEDRYQAPVDAGIRERRIADRMLIEGFKPQCPKLAFVRARPPWRVV